MNSFKFFAILILLTPVAARFAIADAEEPSADTESDYTLTLRYGKATPLSPEAVESLYAKTVELLETSNFNSRAPLWEWNMSEILEGYRRTVAGKYLLVSFNEPRTFKTIGGEVSVREIVIGLNRPDFASALFTIDDEGRIVGHAKYSGLLCIDFLKLAKKIVGED